MGDAADDAERRADQEREEEGSRRIEIRYVGPVEQTERAAEDSAIRFLLDGLDVESIHELKRLVDSGRMLDHLIEAAGANFTLSFDTTPLLP